MGTVRGGERAGKTFSVTGWKVGYVAACPELLAPVARAHQFVTFTVPPMLQQAVAVGLGFDESYFTGLAATLQARRDLLAGGLGRLGIPVLPVERVPTRSGNGAPSALLFRQGPGRSLRRARPDRRLARAGRRRRRRGGAPWRGMRTRRMGRPRRAAAA